MNKGVIERKVTLEGRTGLHARPASIFVQNAKRFQSRITLSKNEKTVDAKSIVSILSLAAEKGDQVVLKADGDDAELALDNLVSLLTEGLI